MQHINHLLDEYYDGELSPARRRQVEAHLAQCPDCRAELEQMRQLSALLNEVREQLPAWELGAGPTARPEPGPALERVLSLKDPLDRFLDDVLVMVDDPAVRDNRLALLSEVRDVLRRLGGLEQLGG